MPPLAAEVSVLPKSLSALESPENKGKSSRGVKQRNLPCRLLRERDMRSPPSKTPPKVSAMEVLVILRTTWAQERKRGEAGKTQSQSNLSTLPGTHLQSPKPFPRGGGRAWSVAQAQRQSPLSSSSLGSRLPCLHVQQQTTTRPGSAPRTASVTDSINSIFLPFLYFISFF